MCRHLKITSTTEADQENGLIGCGGMSAIRLFWWSPAKSLSLAVPEVRGNPGVWLRLAAQTGRFGRNFGDELSPLILEAATGKKVVWASPSRAEVVAIGSILDLYANCAKGATVWGSGLRSAIAESERQNVRERFGPILAVRGPNTAESLGISRSSVTGDPGVLIPMLLGRQAAVARKMITVIPHFRTWASKSGRSQLAECHKLGFDVLPPTLSPIVLANRVRDSSFVMSSSLHGLVFAHALGVPAQLISIGQSEHKEPGFKYNDYLLSVGLKTNVLALTSILGAGQVKNIIESNEEVVGDLLIRTSQLAEKLLAVAASI